MVKSYCRLARYFAYDFLAEVLFDLDKERPVTISEDIIKTEYFL